MSNAVFPSAVRGLGFSVLRSIEDSVIVQTAPNFVTTRIQQNYNPLWSWELLYDFLIDNPLKPTATLAYTDLKTMMGFFQARGANFDDFLFIDPDDNTVGPGMITALWQRFFPYFLGAIIIDGVGASSHAQKVTVAPAGAKSGLSQPTWNHAGGTTVDGGLTWTDLGVALNTGTNWPNPQAQLQLIQDSITLVWYSPIQRNLGGQFNEDITDLQPAGGIDYTTLSLFDNGTLQTHPGNYVLVGPGLAINGFTFRGLVAQWVGTPTGSITATFNFYFRVRFEMSRQNFEKWMNQWWAAGGETSTKSDAIKLISSRLAG